MTAEDGTLITAPLLGELTYREWHALIDGIYCGYVSKRDTEYNQEKHYWRVGYLLGDTHDRVTSD